MQAPSQDFVHALAVLKSIQERMVKLRRIMVAGISRVVETENHLRMTTKDPLLHSRHKKWKSFPMNHYQIKLGQVAEPHDAASGTVQGL